MKRFLSRYVVCVATVCLGLLATTTAFAQKAGTTITINADNATGLFASGAQGSSFATQVFSLVRHNNAHVQVFASNDGILDDNTKLYNDAANNFLFDTSLNKELTISHGQYSAKDANGTTVDGNRKSYSYCASFIAIVAPKGYRFIRYDFDIDGSNSYDGAYLSQVTYDSGSEAVVDGVTISSAQSSQSFANTISDGSNILYFKLRTTTFGTTVRLAIRSIKLSYVIDQPFSNQLPTADSETRVHTGFLVLGKFKNNKLGNGGLGFWTFSKSSMTDYQYATIYQDGDSIAPDVVTLNGSQYYVAASAGDYYIEAPQKFRIIGATLNFLRQDAKIEATTVSEQLATTIVSGNEYILSDGNGNYLSLNGSSITNVTDTANATKWTITNSRNGYTIKSGDTYLYLSESGYGPNRTYSLSTNTNSTSWTYDNGFYKTIQQNWSNTSYYINCSSATWGASTSNSSCAKPYTIEIETSEEDFTAVDFKATVHDREDNKLTPQELTSDNASYSLTLDDLNNDAIHFHVNNSALYNVNLQLMPLNPELQQLSVASQVNGELFKNATSFEPTNYVFNNGEAMTLVVPNTDANECTVKFLDAYNEEGTTWYKNRTDGYSNYFLVASSADKGGSEDVNLDRDEKPAPDARTSAEQAGTEKLYFTNIKEIYEANGKDEVVGPDYLIDNEFKKMDAEYTTATLRVDSVGTKPYYVYSADMPTYNILKNAGIDSKHIDFRYYTLNLQCKRQVDVPDVTITPIYTKTLKSQNHKNTGIASDGSKLDEDLTFFGATVKAKLADGQTGTPIGYLTSQQVVEGLKNAVVEYAKNPTNDFKYKNGDELRGMLYADLTSLSRTDNEVYTADFHKATADNCLYFMYEGFSQANLDNVVVKTKNGNFESASNVKLYDQQPFFSPYDFNTAQYAVSYDREGTVKDANGNKEKVTKMAVVLPFDVNLNGEGKLKTASDVTDNSVTYHNITGSGDVEGTVNGQPRTCTYGVVAEPVTANVAEANKPYYVETTSDGFSYNILGAQFRKSGTIENNVVTMDKLTNSTEGTWDATGTYAGITPDKAEGLWYFSQNLFWNSGLLENFSVVNVRPFRAYFTTSDKTNAKSARVVYSLDDIITGICGVTAGDGKALDITVGNGQINVTANAATTLQIHTLAGQIVAKGRLDRGESRSVSVPQGIYIVNNVKVVVK